MSGLKGFSARALSLLLIGAMCTVMVPVVATGADAPAASPGGLPPKAPPGSAADAAGNPYVAGELLVKFKSGVSALSSAAVHASIGARKAADVKGVKGLQVAKLPKGLSAEAAAAIYRRSPSVAYAQPNYLHHVDAIPNDPRFGELWGMDNRGQTGGTPDADIDAPEAWDEQTGDDSVVVAVIDTGVDYNHPDLADNMWVNPGEVAGNGIDDDGNGCIDDVHGYDFANEDADPMDDYGHGTHCSGTIGAVGDNDIGVAGVAWDVQIMAMKFLDAGGWGTTEDAIECIVYADMMGADIMSNSWGGGPYEQALFDAIAGTDALFVAAAGNWGEDTDVNPNYPSCYDSPNVLAVGASDPNDEQVNTSEWASNYGAETVDVFAPGLDILSTVPGPPSTFTPDVLGSELINTCDNAGDWDLTAYEINAWEISDAYYVSEPASLAHLDYANKENAYAILATPIDLSSYSNAVLRFQAYYETEPTVDLLHTWVSADGVDWTLVSSLSGWSDGFRQIDCNISGLAGDPDVYIAFSFTSDGSIDSKDGYLGVAVDDIEIVEMDPLFQEDFSTLDAWDASEYAQQPWDLTSEWFVSAPTAVANLNYLEDESAWLKLADPIDMSTVTDGVALTAHVLYATDPGFDFMRVWASTDGMSWDPLAKYSGWSGMFETAFEPIILDVSAYAGEPEVFLAFSFESDGIPTGDLGVAVDDVVVVRGEWSVPDYTDAYWLSSGTSMATPHVSGIAALVLSEWPGRSAEDLKMAVMKGADPLPQLDGLCVTGARANAYNSIQDLWGPIVTDDNTGSYTGVARIHLTATDDSGVASITYWFDDDAPTVVAGAAATAVNAIPAKLHTLTYFAEDTRGNVSDEVTVDFKLARGTATAEPIAGANRYATAVAASKKAFPGGADAAVLATGLNWPDAMGGSALAGVVNGPLLLTQPSGAPGIVLEEIKRLGAETVYILGSEASVSGTVANQIKSIVGAAGVIRIAGPDRYATSALVAEKVIALSPDYDGMAFVATGANFPDALSAAPIATRRGWPVLLANPKGTLTVPEAVTAAVIVGGEGSVSSGIEGGLDGLLGDENVIRKAGPDRYATSALVAAWGVGHGLHWEGVGLATGATFADALSGGVMLGHLRSPLLLTRTDALPPSTKAPLSINKQLIQTVRFIGGTGSVSNNVRMLVMQTLQ